MNRLALRLIILGTILWGDLYAQDHFTTHYFASASAYNPSLVGDTRFGQFNLVQRMQPTAGKAKLHTTLLSYNQKVRNMHSGIGVSATRKLSSFSETQVRINYGYSNVVLKKIWVKAGFGLGLNSLNTHVDDYLFPDQFNRYGYNGMPTMEPNLIRKASYVSFALGGAVYGTNYWFTAAADNLNRPSYELGGDKTKVPFFIQTNGGYLFPLDKNKRSQRIISRNGGINPYSCMGPVVSFIKNGPLNSLSIGVNTFWNPVFWGVNYRYYSIRSNVFSGGSYTLHFQGGYRNQYLSIGYSHDFILKSDLGHFHGAHEVSLIYYIYSVKEDYRKHALIPYPNQLKY